MKYRHVFSLRLSLMSFYSLERGYKGSMAELSTANLYYDDANANHVEWLAIFWHVDFVY